MAVGRGDHHRLAAHPGDPPSPLTSSNPSQRAGKETRGPWNPRPPGPAAGPPSYRGTKIQPQNATPRRPAPAIKPGERSGLGLDARVDMRARPGAGGPGSGRHGRHAEALLPSGTPSASSPQAGGHYLMIVKGNQPLLDAVAAASPDHRAGRGVLVPVYPVGGVVSVRSGPLADSALPLHGGSARHLHSQRSADSPVTSHPGSVTGGAPWISNPG